MCQRCHEMRPYYQSWQHSAHRSVECAQCHIPSGTVGLLLSKIGALREVYVRIAGEGFDGSQWFPDERESPDHVEI